MMWFIPFQRHFEIRMVITEQFYDEMMKNSSHIDEISVEASPIPGIMPAAQSTKSSIMEMLF